MTKIPPPLALAVVSMLAVGVFAQTRPRRVDPNSPARTTTSAAVEEGAAAPTDVPVTLEGTLIEVPVVVSDRAGHYVPDLTQNDFELREDGQRQHISFFRSERVPIHVALLLDTSRSTRYSLGEIQDAAIDFVDLLMPGDQIMIVSFAREVTIEQEFTSDRQLLVDAVHRTRPTLGTRLYEAVYRTIAERLRSIEGHKAIVILSDGQDKGSAIPANQAVESCSESDVAVYGIRYPRAADLNRERDVDGLDLPFPRRTDGPRMQPRRNTGLPRYLGSPAASPQRGVPTGRSGRSLDPFMERIATASGGAVYYAGTISDLGALFGKIAEELRHVYVIGYAPSNTLSNGGYRRIEVRIPHNPDLAIRHRLGYQADSQP